MPAVQVANGGESQAVTSCVVRWCLRRP